MARSFNGSTDQILTANYNTAAPTGTLAVWAKNNGSSASYSGLCGHVNSGSTSGMIIYLKSTGALAFYVFATGSPRVDPAQTAPATAWFHAASTYDSVNGLNVYLNGGAKTNAGPNGAIVAASAPLAVGYDFNAASRNFSGSLAEVAEWNVALSPQEISAVANGQPANTIRPQNLLAYLRLDGYRHPAFDYSGNGHLGTLTGTKLTPGPPLTSALPLFTPQSIKSKGAAAAAGVVFRRTLSALGTRAGSRQAIIR